MMLPAWNAKEPRAQPISRITAMIYSSDLMVFSFLVTKTVNNIVPLTGGLWV